MMAPVTIYRVFMVLDCFHHGWSWEIRRADNMQEEDVHAHFCMPYMGRDADTRIGFMSLADLGANAWWLYVVVTHDAKPKQSRYR